MDVSRYLEIKKQRQEQETRSYGRSLCWTCLQPLQTCYCQHVHAFDPKMKFIILIHPLELRRRIATGRMSHLCLQHSQLILGHDYTANARVNQILSDPGCHSVILYPGFGSTNLSKLAPAGRRDLFPPDKELAIFVIDGTWSTARKMLKHSRNLRTLPRICFTPERPSTFRVRKQPKPECYSTVEAIHQTLELVGPTCGFDITTREHDGLLQVFGKMVEQQLEFIRISHTTRRFSRHRRGKS